MNKGAASNLVSLLVLAAGGGIALAPAPGWLQVLGSWLTAVGLFGFAGGVTNWLAVKMLFDRVPLLYGSGVIPARFREIRVTIKNLIMTHFFDEEHLQRFYREHAGLIIAGEGIEEGLVELLESDEAGRAIERQLEELKSAPFGMLIRLAGTDILRTVVQEFLKGLAIDLGPQLQQQIQGRLPDVRALQQRVDLLLESKLEELTPETVKRMMEHVIREHLGWLIVWGNVFGGLIGLASKAATVYLGAPGLP
ncbi:MAG: DUF445 family protein [Gemmatimonadota bacterium]